MIEDSKKLHIVADEILEALTKKKDQGEIHGFSLDIQTMVKVPFVGILQNDRKILKFSNCETKLVIIYFHT